MRCVYYVLYTIYNINRIFVESFKKSRGQLSSHSLGKTMSQLKILENEVM